MTAAASQPSACVPSSAQCASWLFFFNTNHSSSSTGASRQGQSVSHREATRGCTAAAGCRRRCAHGAAVLLPLPHLGDQAALDVDHKSVAHIVLLQTVLHRGGGQEWQQAWEDSNTARAGGQGETRRRNAGGVFRRSHPCEAGSSQGGRRTCIG